MNLQVTRRPAFWPGMWFSKNLQPSTWASLHIPKMPPVMPEKGWKLCCTFICAFVCAGACVPDLGPQQQKPPVGSMLHFLDSMLLFVYLFAPPPTHTLYCISSDHWEHVQEWNREIDSLDVAIIYDFCERAKFWLVLHIKIMLILTAVIHLHLVNCLLGVLVW